MLFSPSDESIRHLLVEIYVGNIQAGKLRNEYYRKTHGVVELDFEVVTIVVLRLQRTKCTSDHCGSQEDALE